jgi:hypothetical protein
VQRDSWKIQGDLDEIQEDLPNRGIMRTYKDSRGDTARFGIEGAEKFVEDTGRSRGNTE